MALTYTNGSSGIFDVLGKLFHLAGVANTARGSTVPTAVDGLIDKFKNDNATTIAMELALSVVPQAQISWQGTGDALLAQLAQVASGYLRGVVARDAQQPADTIDNALAYLIEQMLADDVYVDPNVVGLSLAAASGNSGNDFSIMYSDRDGSGAKLENQLAEAIAIDLTSAEGLAVTVRTLGKATVSDLSADWPKGSGHSLQFAAVNPASSLLTNGDLDDMSVANIPDNWILLDGLPGTDYLMTGFEVQDVAIAGTPTAGGYYLRFTSPAGPVYTTERLPFDATSAQVQTALQALPGLGAVTVATQAGTSPNFTHRVTFNGVAGNLTTLAAEDQLDTGSITPSQVTAGDANAYRGRSLKVVGAAAANMRIYHVLPTLQPDTTYFVSLRHKKTGTPAAGTVRVAVVQGYGGAVTQDFTGNNNSVTYDLTTGAVTTSYAAGWLAIRVKATEAQPLYLEIDVQNLSAGTTYCLDDVTLSLAQETYAGGPLVAAVVGNVPPVLGDKWTLTATNNRAGSFQEWFSRVYSMRSRRLVLPSAGSTNIPDSLIA